MIRGTSTPKTTPPDSNDEESLLEDTNTTITGSPIVAESGYTSASHLSQPFSPSSASFFSDSASYHKETNSPPDTVSIHPKHKMTTMESLEQANNDLTKQVSDLKTSIAQILTDNVKLTSAIDDLQAQNKKATDALNTSVQALQNQSTSFNDQYRALEQSLRDADTNINNLKAELDVAQAKINQYEAEKPTQLDDLCKLLKDLVSKETPSAPTPKPRGPNLTLPRFDGSLYNSFEKWRMELEQSFKYFDWKQNDPQCANIIPTLLDDFAHAHYLSLSPEQKSSYVSCIAALEQQFSMQKKPISVRRNYLNRKQKHNETVRDFSSIILHRFSECNTPLESQVDIFLNNLLPQIAAEIQDEDYASINALVTCAEKAEHKLKLRKDAAESMNALSFRPRRSRSRGRSFSRNRSFSKNRSQSRNRSSSRSRYDNPRQPRYNNPNQQNTRRDKPNADYNNKYSKQSKSNTTNYFQRRDRSQSRSRPRPADQINCVDTNDQQFYDDLNC